MEITSLGNCPSTLLDDIMRVDGDIFRDCLEATAAAGFDALSLYPFHLALAGDGAADAVRSSGLTVRAVEAAIGWTNGPSVQTTAEIDGLIATGVDLGADIVGAACLGPIEDRAAAVEGLASIAARAAEADMVVAVEFLPWTGLPTLAAVDDLVLDAGEPNATILFDTFHWVRQPGGPDLERLRSLPGDRIAYVQLCEPSDVADIALDRVEDEAMHHRRVPGSGGVDLDAVWQALDHIGSDPFVAAEVFNDDLLARGRHTMAAAVHDATRAALPTTPSPN